MISLRSLFTFFSRYFVSKFNRHSAFTKATYPLFVRIRKLNKKPIAFADMQAFATRYRYLPLRKDVTCLLRNMGFEAVEDNCSATDIYARREGQGIVVRCMDNAHQLRLHKRNGATVEDMNALIDKKNALGAQAAVMFSYCSASVETRDMLKGNALLSVDGFVLVGLLRDQGVVHQPLSIDSDDSNHPLAASLG